ncbi:MAG: hypothetical protein D6675_09470 [Gemmatimonadetes bacterium]|nr:MAG: hypothetical protein D6675_09470 [Gemmatimonadota bacterium]
MRNLTRREQEVLLFIESYRVKTGVFPSFEEISQQLKLRSNNLAAYYVQALKDKRYLQRVPVSAFAVAH